MLKSSLYDVVVVGSGAAASNLAAQVMPSSKKIRADGAVRLEGIAADQLPAVNAFAQQHPELDIFIVPTGLSVTDIRVMAFDMDSTLADMECIDDMARVIGRGDEVAAITHGAMHGALSFDESLRRRCAILRGMTVEQVEKVVAGTRLNPGAEDLIAFCHRHGIATWIISGGFTLFTEPLAKRLGMQGVVCNELVVKDGALTGEVTGMKGAAHLTNAQGKADALAHICEVGGFPITQAIACGDGANDLKMVEAAGIGVAYHGKPILQQAADCRINHEGLNAIELFFTQSWS